jgi:hypothetical protein
VASVSLVPQKEVKSTNIRVIYTIFLENSSTCSKLLVVTHVEIMLSLSLCIK